MRGPLFLRVLVARVRAWFRRDGVAGEIKDELDFHLASRVAEYERAGCDPDAARRKARARVGNLAVHADRGYDIRGGGMIETILQDVRQGVRLLRRQPGFAAVAIATMALAIGASTAVFSVIDAALLRPLPYPHPEQLVKVGLEVRDRDRQIDGAGPSLEDVRLWAAAGGHGITHVAILRNEFPERVIEAGTPERVSVAGVTEQYLPLHGVQPLHGRTFAAADLEPGAAKVIVLGFNHWRSRFAADPTAVGRTVRFDGAPATIIGVLPPFKASVAIWRPLTIESDEIARRNRGWDVVARRRADLTDAEAAERLTALTRAARAEDVASNVRLSSLRNDIVSDYTTTVTIVATAVAVVLLIACVNVAGLLLARGATRRQELAVRASMGAGRWRLARQLLTESLVLAGIGGAAGVVLAWLSIDLIAANIPIELQDDAPATVNALVLAASAALTIVTGIVFGGWPALRLSRVRVSPTIAREGRESVTPLSRRGGQALIAAEIALAVVLLAGAGLMLRSFSRILDVDLGLEPSKFLAMETSTLDPDPATQAAFYPALLASVRRLPGVTQAGAVDFMPLGEMRSIAFADVVGGKKGQDISPHQVTPGFFQAMGITVRQGRVIEEADMTANERVAVINESGARKLFDGENPVGRQINLDGIFTIVGVVADVRMNGPTSDVDADLYLPYKSVPSLLHEAIGMSVIVRTDAVTPRLAEQLRDAARAIGPRVLVERVRTGDALVGSRIVRPRQRTVLLSMLGGLGLLLAIVGVLGMTSYAVARRTREIGLRMAFGALPRQVVGTMVRDAALPVALGVLAGVVLAMFSTGLIASFLFKTTPTDPATLAAVAITLAVTGVMAAWIPARRAARVDPVSALRAE